MKKALQWVSAVFIILGLVACIWQEQGMDRVAAMAPAGKAVWQQGLWPLHDRLAETVGARMSEAGRAAGPAFRVAVVADTSEVPEYRFASLTTADLVMAMKRADGGKARALIACEGSVDRPDLLVSVVLKSYRPGKEDDVLSGIVTYTTPDGLRNDEPFEARCPTHGRAWFVRAVSPPFTLLMMVSVLVIIAGGIAVWGAYDAFLGDFQGKWRMCGSVFALGLLAYLLIAYLCEPGLSRFGIPRRQVTVALDTSDAVRFPVVPGATLPKPGQAGTNDLCRFLSLCISEIGKAIDGPNAQQKGGGFPTWIRLLARQMDEPGRQSELLSVSDGMEIVHSLPAAGGVETNGVTMRTPLSRLPELLESGHRQTAPAFFLPWLACAASNDNQLVVSFTTGEPASWRQVAWLRQNRDALRGQCPTTTRVLSVLLPCVSRSGAPDWGPGMRSRNVASVSDVVVTLGGAGMDRAALDGFPVTVESYDLFAAAATGKAAVGQSPPGEDLDALRSRLICADVDSMRSVAARLAERVRGMADLREASIFQMPPFALWALVVSVASLALFIGLQRELRLLDDQNRVTGHRWLTWPGALVGLVCGGMVALVIGYVTSEPARWRTLALPGTVLWSVITLWYAGIWLPMLLGRSMGRLPASPIQKWQMRCLFLLFCFSMCAVVVTGVVASLGSFGGWIGKALLGVLALLFFSLTFSYGAICFHRVSRQWVCWLGFLGLFTLFLVIPALRFWNVDHVLSERSGVALWAWGLVLVMVVILMPSVWAPIGVRKTTGLKDCSIGWAPSLGALAGLVSSLLLYAPVPLSHGSVLPGFLWAWGGHIVMGAAGLLFLLWLVKAIRE